MRISDWSSDVCSSDLDGEDEQHDHAATRLAPGQAPYVAETPAGHHARRPPRLRGSPSCRGSPLEQCNPTTGRGVALLVRTKACPPAVAVPFRPWPAGGRRSNSGPTERSEEHTSEPQPL